MNRRGFLIGAGALIAAPSIVRAASLMPVRGIVMPVDPWGVVSINGRCGAVVPSYDVLLRQLVENTYEFIDLRQYARSRLGAAAGAAG